MNPIAAKRRLKQLYLGPAPVHCWICGASLSRESAIAPETSSELVFLCGVRCHESWRHAISPTQRLAANGDRLDFKE